MRVHYLLVAAALLPLGCKDNSTGDGGDGNVIDSGPGPAVDANPNAPDAFQASCEGEVPGTPALALELVASGFTDPVAAVVPPGDTRIFVVEKPGLISIIENGQKVTPPFLNITSLIDDGGERGLLGLAFHPDYVNNKRFYVYYTANGTGTLTLAQYTATSTDDADEASGDPILEITHPASNHNGGWIAFGPDGFLYMATGDGGGGGDTQNNAQTTDRLLGKILRLDVNTSGAYGIPPNNPFVGMAGFREEIWAYGVRNPWRNSFDLATGDLYIADVGQDAWEEINVQPAGVGGQNYGWRQREAKHCFNPANGCITAGMTEPVYEYSHDANNDGDPNDANDRGSIAGGFVYRGCKMPGHHGRYFFADTRRGFIRSFKWDGAGGFTDEQNHANLASEAQVVYGFGQDINGEILILDQNNGTGQVYRIIPAP